MCCKKWFLAISAKYAESSPFFMTNVVPSPIEHESKFVFILTIASISDFNFFEYVFQ
jgi:hypothetical protein